MKINNNLLLIHPFLYVIVFVLLPFMQLAGLIPLRQIVVPAMVMSVLTALIYALVKLYVKKDSYVVAIVSPLVAVLCGYGILYEYISGLTRTNGFRIPVLATSSLVLLALFTLYIVYVLKWREGTIRNSNKLFFLVAITLIVVDVCAISFQFVSTKKTIASITIADISAPDHKQPLPDIYYIIIDEYAAPSQMKSFLNYDMSPFVEHLRQKGFTITELADKSSLGTSTIIEERLNMRPYNQRNKGTGLNSIATSVSSSVNMSNTFEEGELIRCRNNRVVLYLKKIGYHYINIGSWLPHTRYNRLADQNINGYGIQTTEELSAVIFHNSILRLILIHRQFHRNAVLKAFSALENVDAKPKSPTFTFAHIICPHIPYVFGAQGEELSVNEGDKNDIKKLYLDQHRYISSKITAFVDHKLASSTTPPVIIIQADHGFRKDKAMAHLVFSAVYLPSCVDTLLPDGISAENTFRLLFNKLFTTSFNSAN